MNLRWPATIFGVRKQPSDKVVEMAASKTINRLERLTDRLEATAATLESLLETLRKEDEVRNGN